MIKIIDMMIPLQYDLDMLKAAVAARLRTDPSRLERINIIKRAVNVQDKQDVHFKMTVEVYVFGDENEVLIGKKDKRIFKDAEMAKYVLINNQLVNRPLVVGCGPAGLFAALILAEAGARPILLERGLDADNRKIKVQEFWRTGVLDEKTNVQFGEGGAGAFSDGKLKIGQKDSRKMKVLTELVEAGAPTEIMYLSMPHIGTDRLSETIKVIREKILRLGGEIRFASTMTGLIIHKEQVAGIRYTENGKDSEQLTDNVVLAIGHSARDTFANLLSSGIHLEQRPFSVGVRIEHSQELIDRIKYGGMAGHPALGAADYKMVVHLRNGRGVYSFCMCPGGMVVAAASEEKGLVTNGMSEYARNGCNANSALLVTVGKEDLGSNDPMAGVAFQRSIEKAAFSAGGGGYKAPVQRLEDFLRKRGTTAFGDVFPTYLPGTSFAEVDSYLPGNIADSLRQGIFEMGEWMPGFISPDAILTGAETRSASPVRITRDDKMEAVGIKGLYPCGEGAGYSGGIISAAVDGVLCAERILCHRDGSFMSQGRFF